MHKVVDQTPEPRDVVVIGGSAGGLESLSTLLEQLPEHFPAIVLAVLHRGVHRESHLQAILRRHCKLPVIIPYEGEALRKGVCYIGLPDRHLVIGPGLRARLIPDGFYKAHNVDALFSSAARHAGSRVLGVVLSGLNKDGTEGLVAIKEAGGMTLVQLPEEAGYPDMPHNAIKYDGNIDFVAPVKGLAIELCRLIRDKTPDPANAGVAPQ